MYKLTIIYGNLHVYRFPGGGGRDSCWVWGGGIGTCSCTGSTLALARVLGVHLHLLVGVYCTCSCTGGILALCTGGYWGYIGTVYWGYIGTCSCTGGGILALAQESVALLPIRFTATAGKWVYTWPGTATTTHL